MSARVMLTQTEYELVADLLVSAESQAERRATDTAYGVDAAMRRWRDEATATADACRKARTILYERMRKK